MTRPDNARTLPTYINPAQLAEACKALGLDGAVTTNVGIALIAAATYEVRVVQYVRGDKGGIRIGDDGEPVTVTTVIPVRADDAEEESR